MVVSANKNLELMPLLGLDITEQYNYHSVFIKGTKTLIIDEPQDYDEWY